MSHLSREGEAHDPCDIQVEEATGAAVAPRLLHLPSLTQLSARDTLSSLLSTAVHSIQVGSLSSPSGSSDR